MNKKIIASSILAALLVLPAITLADINPGASPGSFGGSVVVIINAILNFIWPIFVGFAVIMFIVAAFLFLSANGDPGKIGTARQAVLWGIVGVVIGVLAFSIPFVVRNTLGL
jgi:hypothetical protein